MSVAARSQRVIAFVLASCLILGVQGCSYNASPGKTAPSVSHPDTAQDAVSRDLNMNTSTLLDFSKSGLGMKLNEKPGTARLTITTGETSPGYEITELDSPPRIVVDLTGTGVRLNRSIDLPESSMLSRVRLGSHGERERVVVDLKKDVNVSHTVESEGGSVTLTLNGNPAAASQAADAGMLAEIAAAPPPADTGEAEMAGKSEMPMADSSADDSTAASDLTPVVTGVRIDKMGTGGNQVIASVTSAGTYKITKTAPTEYVVAIEDAKLDDGARKTVLAPPGEGAIRSVRAVQEGSNVLLRIFTEDGVILSAEAHRGAIRVAPADALTAADSDAGPMAQLATGDDTSSGDAEGSGDDDSGENNDIASLLEAESQYTGRLISLDLQDTDIDNALRIIAEVSNLNIIASDDVTGKVTLRLIDVPWDQALDVILKTNGLDKVQELNVIRVAPVEKLRAEREALKEAQMAKQLLEPLLVRYIRISYARAADIQPLVETVLTERGSVATDDRTNQIIVKDIQDGIQNVAELVKKLDLRTPQVLLETQIVEAQRTFLRDLGTELGFNYIKSPEKGNATGYNFPNSIDFSGAATPDSNSASSFPAAISDQSGSAIAALFGSADGAVSLDLRLSSLEKEGRIRIVSRPSVATVNNKQAVIKSVEKIRVKLPSSGLSVATGQGASATGGGNAATESFEVGITLEVVPQASPDYYVLLDINAKSSTLGATVVDGIPSEIERSATSTVLVSSGQTFALGGIYKITDKDTLEGVPFFKDIPVFGHLFRRSLVDNADEELIFFITPRIVEGSFDDAAMKAVGAS